MELLVQREAETSEVLELAGQAVGLAARTGRIGLRTDQR
jgi:hypothetical protein